MRRSDNSRWKPEDDQRLLDLMDAEASWPLIAITLNRSVHAVQKRARKLKGEGVEIGLKAKAK